MPQDEIFAVEFLIDKTLDDGTAYVAGARTLMPAYPARSMSTGAVPVLKILGYPSEFPEVKSPSASRSSTATILMANLPAASAANNGMEVDVSDANGGTRYKSDGVTWRKVSPGVTEYDIASSLWADRGVGVIGQVKRITDVGNNPLLEAIWDGTRWAPRGGRQLIYSSRGNIDGPSNTTSAANIPAVTIPGGLLGVNFGLDIEIATHTVAGVATTANTVSLTFDGFELFGTDRTTNRRLWLSRRIRNVNAANVQTVMANASATGANEGAANDPKETTKNSANNLVLTGTATAVAATAMVNRIDEYKVWWIGA